MTDIHTYRQTYIQTKRFIGTPLLKIFVHVCQMNDLARRKDLEEEMLKCFQEIYASTISKLQVASFQKHEKKMNEK